MENIAKLTSYGCYLDCDFETARYPGDETHIVGNVAEYVYDLEQKISDLEAKLAESESKVAVGRFWHSAYEGKQLDYDKLNNDYNKQEKLLSEVLADKSKLQFEFDQLKQQLAEKETRIAELEDKDWYEGTIKQLEEQNERLINQLAEKEKQIAELEEHDKIYHNQLAVEQLEKVKEYIHGKYLDETWHNKIVDEDREDTHDFIDNQIKQLKDGKWCENQNNT